MKTAKLIINGKEYEVQLTDEQVTEIEKPKKVTGFERVKRGEVYFFADSDGDFSEESDEDAQIDYRKYKNANYYSDVTLAEWCFRSDNLNRKMRRWAAEHNEEPINWTDNIDPAPKKYTIYYRTDLKELHLSGAYCTMAPCKIYFATEEIAKAAIKEFGDEIKWLAENRPKWF